MENVDNLVIEHLRAIRKELGMIREDTREIKSRLVMVEIGITSLKHDAALQYGDLIETHHRYDRINERIERIERRLEIEK